MNGEDDNRIEERMPGFLKAIEQDVPPPDEAFLQRLRDQSTEAFLRASATGPTNAGRHSIMNKRTLRWFIPIAAAAAAVLLMVGVWPGETKSGRAYAMTDVPELLRSAKTLHITGRLYLPPYAMPGHEQTEVPYEIWADPENCRFRSPQTYYGVNTAGEQSKVSIAVGEVVSDGQYRMTVNHTEKTVKYELLNAFHRRLLAKLDMEELHKDVVARIEAVGGFTKTGEEEIDGRTYGIWEGIVKETDLPTNIKVMCWLDSERGEIGRVQEFTQGPFGDAWAPAERLDTIARNVQPPADVFDTSPPAGYKLLNTKEDAKVPELHQQSGGGVGSLSYSGHIAFQIGERAILLGWSSRDEEDDTSQAGLFSGLKAGGPLPKLPVEVVALKTAVGKETVLYKGQHLAFTRKEDRYVEWSLYVADREPPAKAMSCGYRIMQRYNVPAERVVGQLILDVSRPIPVGPDDFDLLVRGAMAEFSDTGSAPEDVTYATVLGLIEKASEATRR